MTIRRNWANWGLAIGLFLLGLQQLWQHGHDYILPRQFAVVEPGKIYRGGWQKDWPMRQIVSDYNIRTVLALAHPDDHPLSVNEKTLAEELGVRWVHIPIVDQRSTASPKALTDLLDEAAAVLADPSNYPIYFHCHHGLNRASMVQIAYRTRFCGWTLDQATDEVARTVGLVKVTHGPDYRHMVDYYNTRVLPSRAVGPAPAAQISSPSTTLAAHAAISPAATSIAR